MKINMKKIFFFLIIVITFCHNTIYALECSPSDKERLQKLANNITYILEEVNDNDGIFFKITFTGLSRELRIYSDRRHFYYYNYSNNFIDEVELRVYSGKIYQFTINGNNTCKYNNFKTFTINIPNVNKYYSDKLCDNIKEYKLCQKWISDSEISYDDFISKVTEYKEQKKEVINNNSITENKDNIFDIYNKFYWSTFIGLMCLLILLIILWIRQNKKNRL